METNTVLKPEILTAPNQNPQKDLKKNYNLNDEHKHCPKTIISQHIESNKS